MNKTTEDRINEYTELMKDLRLDYMTKELTNMGFFQAPASTRYHGNYTGGLFDHSLAVTKSLLELTEKLGLTWEKHRSPYIVGMFHDLCKCDAYVFDASTGSYKYNPDLIIPGHAERSIILLQKHILLTDEEIACIRFHMGAFEGSEIWNQYGNAIEQYPNVLFTHTADMIASRIEGV